MTELLGTPKLLADDLVHTAEQEPSDPAAGELWTLAWDGRFLALACIAEASHSYVLAWPVTLPGEPAYAPALRIDDTPLQHELYIWPDRETGIGNHLLDRRIGQLIPAEPINPIARAVRRGEQTRYPYADGLASDPANSAADAAMVEHWTDLCFHVWPPEDRDTYLSGDRIRAQGGSSRTIAEALGIGPTEVAPLWNGVRPIDPADADRIAAALNIEIDGIVGGDPLQAVVDQLSSPRYKALIADRARELGVGEGTMRDAVRSDFTLAARDDSRKLADAKIRDAIARAAPTGGDRPREGG